MIRLVEHLCPRLGPAGLSVLYEHLRELPLQYEEMHVELIRTFAEAAGTWATRASSAGGGGAVESLAGEWGKTLRLACIARWLSSNLIDRCLRVFASCVEIEIA